MAGLSTAGEFFSSSRKRRS
ncbi:hypothetical protein A4U53_025165 [Rhizobium ruizarguesonis]|uniref:Uncharacterized protein n=1 Tax=Rhizobium ruizarguesonis TaxID=2081791 RepID=A0ACD5EUW2_9HYPH